MKKRVHQFDFLPLILLLAIFLSGFLVLLVVIQASVPASTYRKNNPEFDNTSVFSNKDKTPPVDPIVTAKELLFVKEATPLQEVLLTDLNGPVEIKDLNIKFQVPNDCIAWKLNPKTEDLIWSNYTVACTKNNVQSVLAILVNPTINNASELGGLDPHLFDNKDIELLLNGELPLEKIPLQLMGQKMILQTGVVNEYWKYSGYFLTGHVVDNKKNKILKYKKNTAVIYTTLVDLHEGKDLSEDGKFVKTQIDQIFNSWK